MQESLYVSKPQHLKDNNKEEIRIIKQGILKKALKNIRLADQRSEYLNDIVLYACKYPVDSTS